MTFGKMTAIASVVLSFQAGSVFADEANPDKVSDMTSKAAFCEKYVVRPGETLATISTALFGNASQAEAIYLMNLERLTSPNDVKPGTVLDMPCAAPSNAGTGKMSHDMDHGSDVWHANAGDFLVPVLISWGKKSGFEVVVEQNSDWKFGIDFHMEGDFRTAIEAVLEGFASSAYPPVVTFYNNNVMTIGVR